MTLYDLITPGGVNPAWWNCPIQEGIPIVLAITYRLLIFGAGLAFFIGILTAVFYYLTAYGDESKAKKGKDALKWSVLGGLIVIFSALLIYWVTSAFIDPSQRSILKVIGDNSFILRGFDSDGNLVQFGKGSSAVCGNATDTETANDTDSEATVEIKTKTSTQNAKKVSDPSMIFVPKLPE